MENRELLLRVAADLIALGKSLNALAGEKPMVIVKADEIQPAPAAEEKKEAEPVKEEAPVAEPKKKYTLVEVRAALSEKSSAGFTTQIRELLQKHGATKLSAIPEEEYEAIMNEVKEIK